MATIIDGKAVSAFLKVLGVNIMLWGTKISTLMLVSLIPRS